jgi:nucleoside-diphosphate-sugar epimerase
MQSVIVTGGSGSAGQYVIAEFQEAGYRAL